MKRKHSETRIQTDYDVPLLDLMWKTFGGFQGFVKYGPDAEWTEIVTVCDQHVFASNEIHPLILVCILEYYGSLSQEHQTIEVFAVFWLHKRYFLIFISGVLSILYFTFQSVNVIVIFYTVLKIGQECPNLISGEISFFIVAKKFVIFTPFVRKISKNLRITSKVI